MHHSCIGTKRKYFAQREGASVLRQRTTLLKPTKAQNVDITIFVGSQGSITGLVKYSTTLFDKYSTSTMGKQELIQRPSFPQMAKKAIHQEKITQSMVRTHTTNQPTIFTSPLTLAKNSRDILFRKHLANLRKMKVCM